MADSNYNSNVWRNFKKNFSFNLNTAGRSVSESAAIAHPIAIPKPSKVGDYTFNRFIRETPALIKDERVRSIATCRTAVDEHMMEQLKIKSYNRYPPIDVNGNIIAPEHYKKHPHYFKPIANLPTTEYLVAQLKMAPPSPYGYHESPFKYTPKKSPAWRFNLKSSNSNYQKALAEIRRYSEEPASREPSVGTRVKTCTPATSTAPSEIL
ncbi:TEX52 [Bugula neritina]|uniref:TEX52 n=1 Tax=Bugula neritina TaxID=10212 RepID=A0A7J7J0D5_BUGNE|nr:TEX52 [Bugula neritina]